MRVISKAAQKTTKWSGGLTTELYIYPEESSYAQRNFDFRLSTATVEVDTSVFTPLQNVQRTLMVLEGKMELIHKNHHQVALGPLDVDNFDGGWETTSYGTCTDFNLMCMNGTKGTVEGMIMKKGDSLEINSDQSHCFIYTLKGAININKTSIEEGALVRLSPNSPSQILAEINSSIVIIKIV